jgi:hypothetical protein
MKINVSVTYVSTVALFLCLSANASIDVSTGVNGGWNYTTGSGTGVASIVASSDADWYSGWIANSAASSWIAANPNNTANNNGTYSLSFDLTGYSLSSVSLSGSWTIDDGGSLYLNGYLLSSLGNGNWGSLAAFSVPSSDFVAGVNTLTIVGGDTDNYLEGVRLQGDVTGSLAPVPEPTTILSGALLLLPFGSSALRQLRKKFQSA